MACALTTGRELPCKTGFGGIKYVYFADYASLGTVTFDGDNTISAFSGSPAWYQYDIKGNSSLETTINSSRENGTTFYAQTLSLTLTYLDNATKEETTIEKDNAIAVSLNNVPEIPSININGKKTATRISVVATIAKEICLEPL